MPVSYRARQKPGGQVSLKRFSPTPNFGVKAMDQLLSGLRSPRLAPRTVIMSSCKVAATTPGAPLLRTCGFEPGLRIGYVARNPRS
jgi:hypothetical protein